MKKILICIQFLLLTTVAYATGQDSDVILQNAKLLQPTGMASPHIGALRRTYSTSTVYDVNTMIQIVAKL